MKPDMLISGALAPKPAIHGSGLGCRQEAGGSEPSSRRQVISRSAHDTPSALFHVPGMLLSQAGGPHARRAR